MHYSDLLSSNFQAQRLDHNFREVLAEYSGNELPIKEMVSKLMMDTAKDKEILPPGIYSPEIEYQLSSIYIDCARPKVTLLHPFLQYFKSPIKMKFFEQQFLVFRGVMAPETSQHYL